MENRECLVKDQLDLAGHRLLPSVGASQRSSESPLSADIIPRRNRSTRARDEQVKKPAEETSVESGATTF